MLLGEKLFLLTISGMIATMAYLSSPSEEGIAQLKLDKQCQTPVFVAAISNQMIRINGIGLSEKMTNSEAIEFSRRHCSNNEEIWIDGELVLYEKIPEKRIEQKSKG